MLDYDQFIPLDAEDLAEGGIGSTYLNIVVPVLKQYVAEPAEVTEECDEWIYRVISQGVIYSICSPEDSDSSAKLWRNATFAFFDIVNRQLENSDVKFYAINGGNDLGGMFLDHQTYLKAVDFFRRRMSDCPYLPE